MACVQTLPYIYTPSGWLPLAPLVQVPEVARSSGLIYIFRLIALQPSIIAISIVINDYRYVRYLPFSRFSIARINIRYKCVSVFIRNEFLYNLAWRDELRQGRTKGHDRKRDGMANQRAPSHSIYHDSWAMLKTRNSVVRDQPIFINSLYCTST